MQVLTPILFYSFTRTFVAILRTLSGGHRMNHANQELQKQGVERDDILALENLCVLCVCIKDYSFLNPIGSDYTLL